MAARGPSPSTKDAIKKLHIQLLFETIAIDYLHEDVDNGRQKKRFLATCKKFFRTERENSMTDVDEILTHFERTAQIGVGDYNVLKEIVQFNRNILLEIEKTEIAMEKLGEKVERKKDNGHDKQLVAEVKDIPLRGKEPWHAMSHDMMEINLLLQNHHIELVSENSDHCELFAAYVQTHNDLMKESNNIIRLLEVEEGDVRLKNFMKLARKSKDLLITHDDAFHKFVSRWRELNRGLLENIKLIEELRRKGAEFQGLLQGSLLIFLRFESIQLLDSFWNEYNNGSLNTGVQNAVCADIVPGEDSFITLSEENYRRYRRYLVQCGRFKVRDDEVMVSHNPANGLPKGGKWNTEPDVPPDADLDKAIISSDYNISKSNGSETNGSTFTSTQADHEKTILSSGNTSEKKKKPTPTTPIERLSLFEEINDKNEKIEGAINELSELVFGKDATCDESLEALKKMCENIRVMKKEIVKNCDIDEDGVEENGLQDLITKMWASHKRTFSQNYETFAAVLEKLDRHKEIDKISAAESLWRFPHLFYHANNSDYQYRDIDRGERSEIDAKNLSHNQTEELGLNFF